MFSSMSPKKIIFFVVVWVTSLAIILGIFFLQRKTTQTVSAPKQLKIWIVAGTTDSYAGLIDGFKEYAPEYKTTDIVFEKKTTDLTRYRNIVLSTMADGTGPDIFMIGAWEDMILESKIEPIPSDVIDFSEFEKRYDDVFSDLIIASGSEDTLSYFLKWVPLGFETLGIFYNKNLVRQFPKTWDEFDVLYREGIDSEVYVSNLWLWPRYMPNAIDIVWLFYMRNGSVDYKTMTKWTNDGIVSYLAYKDATTSQDTTDAYTPIVTIESEKAEMDEKNTTTLDMFMRWDIAMILGYPSLITDLEKSDKRVWVFSKAGLIFTERIPLESPIEWRKNLAKYNYFALSRTTENPLAGAKFLEYLMTSDAQKRYLAKNPYTISAQREYWKAQEWTSLSSVINKSTLTAFIPEIDEELSVFWYWLKAEFNTFLAEYIDRTDNIDINNISENISQKIWCSISISIEWKESDDCEK